MSNSVFFFVPKILTLALGQSPFSFSSDMLLSLKQLLFAGKKRMAAIQNTIYLVCHCPLIERES